MPTTKNKMRIGRYSFLAGRVEGKEEGNFLCMRVHTAGCVLFNLQAGDR